jgi:CheY-like chemotaxis protein
VTTVTSARDALSKLGAGERFDLILCDLMMPEMTGMDLYDELQQSMADQAAKFIFMSSGAFTENARAFLARSSNEVIDKPFRGRGSAGWLPDFYNERVRPEPARVQSARSQAASGGAKTS